MLTVGLLANIKAKPGKEQELADLLSGAVILANEEAETVAWFAFRLAPDTFGIYDAFADDAGRQAHLEGPIAAALMGKAEELLAEPPSIQPVDVLASKLPG